jgi:hypothetical protein
MLTPRREQLQRDLEYWDQRVISELRLVLMHVRHLDHAKRQSQNTQRQIKEVNQSEKINTTVNNLYPPL